MADYLTNDADLSSVANAIRSKGGTSAQLEFPAGFVSAIQAIPTGGGGSSITNVTFAGGDYAYFGANYMAYVDGNLNYQTATAMITPGESDKTYQMLSKSLFVMKDNVDPDMSSITTSVTGMTRVDKQGSTRNGFIVVYQVD